MSPKQRRAQPLPPEERRQAIIRAVIPLLLEKGSATTTREMAAAAGIAEGTIFRVFPDKCALIHEAIKVSMDPAPVETGLAQIYPAAPIDVQLAEAARIILEHFEEVVALLMVLRSMAHSTDQHPAGPPPFVAESNAAVLAALTELFERHRSLLRLEPDRAAAIFRGLLFAGARPMVTQTERLTVDEIVGVMLSGVIDPTPVGAS